MEHNKTMSRPAAKLQWPDLSNIIRKLVSQSAIADFKSNSLPGCVGTGTRNVSSNCLTYVTKTPQKSSKCCESGGNPWSFQIWAVFLPTLDTIKPKNNTTNTCQSSNAICTISNHETLVELFSQNQSKCPPNRRFSQQDKKANKVLKTLQIQFILGVSHIGYQSYILKTFEEFWSHGSWVKKLHLE